MKRTLQDEVVDAAALAGLMHDLGQIVYYGDDVELRDIVVLNPVWLTHWAAGSELLYNS